MTITPYASAHEGCSDSYRTSLYMCDRWVRFGQPRLLRGYLVNHPGK